MDHRCIIATQHILQEQNEDCGWISGSIITHLRYRITADEGSQRKNDEKFTAASSPYHSSTDSVRQRRTAGVSRLVGASHQPADAGRSPKSREVPWGDCTLFCIENR